MAQEKVVPIREEPTYKASDVVTTVNLAMDIGAGKIALQSYVLNVAGIDALKAELDKMTEATDWLGAKYRLRDLKLRLQAEEEEITIFRVNRTNAEARWMTEWSEVQKKRGDFRMTESQRSVITGYENKIESTKTKIAQLKTEITITEAILAGAK